MEECATENQKVHDHGNAMQGAEGMAGLADLLKGDAPRGAVLNPVVFVEGWLDEHSSNEDEGAESENDVFLKRLRPPAGVEPVGQKMEQGNGTADVLKDVITFENDLSH